MNEESPHTYSAFEKGLRAVVSSGHLWPLLHLWCWLVSVIGEECNFFFSIFKLTYFWWGKWIPCLQRRIYVTEVYHPCLLFGHRIHWVSAQRFPMETKQISYLKGDRVLVFLIKPAARFSLVVIHFLWGLDIKAISYFHDLNKLNMLSCVCLYICRLRSKSNFLPLP